MRADVWSLWILSMVAMLGKSEGYNYLKQEPCVDPVSGAVGRVGQTFYPLDRCERWTCVTVDQQSYMDVLGCDLVANPGVGCHVDSNSEANYPGCCSRAVCD